MAIKTVYDFSVKDRKGKDVSLKEYAGEVMLIVNRNVHGRQEVGHIDLLARISYIEVPEQDAEKVMRALNGATYRNRTVRCNDADDTAAASSGDGKRGSRRSSDRDGGRTSRRKDAANDANPYEKRSKRRNEMEGRNRSQRGQRGGSRYESGRQDDWRQFINNPDIQLKGEEPDFSELVCKFSGAINGFSHVKVVGERTAVHGTKVKKEERAKRLKEKNNIEVDANFFKNKIVCIWDDVVTTGTSFCAYTAQLEQVGAHVTNGIFLGKTSYKYVLQ